MPINDQYVQSLGPIYRDILAAYPQFDSTRKAGNCLSFQSLYSALDGKYNLGPIQTACKKMRDVGIMEIKNGIFACPTQTGEELISAITGKTTPDQEVPPIGSPF